MSNEDRVRLRAYYLWLEAGQPEGTGIEHWLSAEDAEGDDGVEEASEDSFPASDPPAHTGIVGPS